MLGNSFKFSTINWTTVPYDLTNSTSNLQNPYQLGASSTIETFFILPPKDPTIYNYTQNGNPILESGFWNNNQFSSTYTTLGDYGNATDCLLYGDISRCTGFNKFAIDGQQIRSEGSYVEEFPAYADNEYLYKGYNTTLFEFPSKTINTSETETVYYGINYEGNFEPNYKFYSSSDNLNNYLNAMKSPVMNITAYYGYYIPVYQTSGNCSLVEKVFGDCAPKTTSVLKMVNNAKNDTYGYQFVEDFLYFANSTSSISFSFPNSIPVYVCFSSGCGEYNYNTTGYGGTLNQTNQSTSVLQSAVKV